MTNMYRLSFFKVLMLSLILGYSINAAKAQLNGGQTYVINGASDMVAPVDTFANLMGAGNSGALTYLNNFGTNSGSSGQITLLLSQGYTGIEPTTIQIGSTTGNGGWPTMVENKPVVLKPAAGLNFVITTTATIGPNQSLVRFNAAQFFTIDGEGTLGQRNITFRMPTNATQSTSRVMDIIPFSGQGVRNLAIKSCNVYGNSTATINYNYAGIYVGGNLATPQAVLRGKNEFITIQNNYIVATQNGIYYRGLANTINNQDNNITIKGNIIGDTINSLNPSVTARVGGGFNNSGIYINAVSKSSVEGNTIRHCLPNSTNYTGISLTHEGGISNVSTDSAILVTKNRIHGLNSTSPGGVYGIRMNLGSHPGKHLAMLIANNSIRDISTTGAQSVMNGFIYPIGILVEDFSDNVGLEIYYNTITLSGDVLPANALSANIAFSPNVSGGVIMMNNIFSNTMGRLSNNFTGFYTYNVINAGTTNPFVYSNFNTYHSNTTGGGYHYVARANNIDFVSLKGYNTYSTSDSSSFSALPPVFNNSDVALVNAGVGHRIWNRGAALDQFWRFSTPVFNAMLYKINDDIVFGSRTNLGRFSSIGCHQWAGDSTNFNIQLNAPRTFPINGVNSYPTSSNQNGSFATISDAIEYLNAYGVGGSGNVIFQLQTGYPGESGYLPILGDYPGSNLGRPVTFNVANGFSATVTIPNSLNLNNSALLRLMGCKWVTFDGGNSKALTFSLPTSATNTISRVIGITPTANATERVTIKNCNIKGNSTTTTINTAFGVYIGAPITAGVPLVAMVSGINNITIQGNIIEGVRTGLYFRAPGASTEALIKGNIIGGNIAPGGPSATTFIGGAFDQSGVYFKGFQNSEIDSNVIRNCLPTTNMSNGFRGIDLDEPGSANYSNVTVSRNFIYDLRTINGQYCTGIRIYLSNIDTINTRNIVLQNNFIGSILGNGSGSNYTTINPSGILIDAQGLMPRPGISLAHNTINLTGTGIGVNNSSCAALFVGPNLRGGIGLVNNIFANNINRTSTGNKFAVLVGFNVSPFTNENTLLPFGSNNNNYTVGGPGNNYIGATASGTALRLNINDWRSFTSPTPNAADGSSFSWPCRFLTDTTPNIDMLYAGLVPTNAAFLSLVCNDIYGNSRFQCAGSVSSGRWVGALEQGELYPALQGNQTYLINGIQNPPTQTNPTSGSFRTVRAAVDYLNSQGVDGSFGGLNQVKLVITTGYVGETDTFITPITLSDYPRQNPNRLVVLTVDAGQNHTITYTGSIHPALVAGSSVIRFSGAQYFMIDGSNNGTTTRNLTIVPPAAFNQSSNKIIDIISGAATITSTTPATSNIIIKNCNLTGNSTTSTNQNFAAIYSGGLVSTPSNAIVGMNNNNIYSNNFIRAVQNGIYLRGTNVRGEQDFGANILNNLIGGNVAPGGSTSTTYFGGITGAAGISLIAQANSIVSGNTIKNNIQNFGTPKGIELQTIIGQNTVLDSNMTIRNNTIFNIISTLSSGAYGIYINFGTDSLNVNRNIKIANNMISGIRSAGASAIGANFVNNPFGIYMDALVNMRNQGNTYSNVNILYNSINLGSTGSLTVANSLSACVGVDSRILGGVVMKNNLFQNKLAGSSTTIRATAVAAAGSVNPFIDNNYNNFFANAASPTNNAHFIARANVAAPDYLTSWSDIMGYTGGDTLSINYNVPFFNDTSLWITANTNSVFHGSAIPLVGYNTDLFGTARNPFAPTMGAHEYDNGTYNDIVSPRIFNISDPTGCNPGFAALNFRIYDRQQMRDTLYYRINGGTPIAIQSAITNGVNRSYFINNIPSGALLEYRISARDFPTPPNVGTYPVNKEWDTLNSNISLFPYNNSFDGVNNPIWKVQDISGNATWEIGAFGSASNPSISSRTGLRSALFESSSFTNGASARLISPCFDLSNTVSPTLRFYVSQNSDLTNKQDSIAVRVSAGGGFWSNPLRTVRRVNSSYNFPGFMLVEVCLSEYNGVNGLRIGIDGYSSGNGHNIVIDDITVYDDAQLQAFSPKLFSQCFRDSITLTVNNSNSSFLYDVINAANGSTVASKMGNGSTLNIRFETIPSDTFRYVVMAANQNSSALPTGFGTLNIVCKNQMPDTVTALINRFYNGPFVIPGAKFTGSFNAGIAQDPDGARVGDTLTYQFVAPSNIPNSSYGTRWTINNIQVKTASNNTMPYTFVAPAGATPGYIRLQPTSAHLDSVYYISFNYRLSPTNCDSLIERVLKVATAPVAQYVNTPSNNVCALTPVNFQSTSIINVDNFPFTYLWLFGDNTNSSVVNPNKTYTTPGVYNVSLIVTDRYGLTSVATKAITVLPAPVVNFTFTTPCAGDSTILTPSSQPAGSNFLWTMPNTSTQTREVAKYNFAKFDTAYVVNLKITNTDGCSNNANKTLYVFSKPKAKFASASHCLSTFVPVSDSSSIANGNALGYTWIWGNGQTSLGPVPVYKYPASGTYNAKLRLSSSFGCIDTFVVPITVFDKPNTGFTYSNACKDDQISLNNTTVFSGGNQNLDYIWNFGDNTFSPDRNPAKVYTSVGTYTIELTSIDKLNGCRDSMRTNVSVYYKPVAQFNSLDQVCERNELKIFNNSYTIDQSPYSCFWDFGNGIDSVCNANRTYMGHGYYKIRLIVTSGNGACKDTAEKDIMVTEAPIVKILHERMDTTSPSFFYGKNKVKYTPTIVDAQDYNWSFGDASGSTSKQVAPTFVYNVKGTYKVRLSMTDASGCVVTDSVDIIISSSIGVQEELASKFSLSTYPNPFASNANVDFTLDKSANVNITVTDLLGRVIKTNGFGTLASGKHTINLDDTYFGSSSTYLIKVSIGEVDIYKTLIKQ